MLYKNNQTAHLDENLFQNPSKEYRGAPFFSWNCKVSEEDIDFVLESLKEMGMGGSHLHSRTGMNINYLSDEFMNKIRYAKEKAKKLDMLTWLYDEDRWPSGFAGGLVTKDTAYRKRYLLFTTQKQEPSKRRVLLTRYEICLKDGCISHYRRLLPDEKAAEDSRLWYLYREYAEGEQWFNGQAYLDTLNPAAVKKFLDITHEAYFREFGEDFGKEIPAIFTDEPQFSWKDTLGFAEEEKDVQLPFTDDFPQTYRENYGFDFFDTFPECIWNLPDGKYSVHRYRYHDHLCERFTESYVDQVGDWCREHGILLTGHVMGEEPLDLQAATVGDAMRTYRSFGIPGIDMLCDFRELNTAKQAQSVVHQYGREGMLSELYGVTNWDFDFRGHKLAGDWQAALGVTVRVHHLTWTSMAGEAKRDYPASIGSQSPWYREYHQIEDYFARLNTALTRGKPVVKVGVIHPMESFWLLWGPKEQSSVPMKERDTQFAKLTEWLLYGLIDFDFIAESLFAEQMPLPAADEKSDCCVGCMKYDAIVVPDCITIRRSTLERLKLFRQNGGKVVFAGRIPEYVDAVVCGDCQTFAQECESVPFTQGDILKSLQEERLLDIRDAEGRRTDNMICQYRQDNENDWLFLSHCRKMNNPDLPEREALTIELKGYFHPVLYDAMSGFIKEVAFTHRNGKTIIETESYDHDSFLYALYPAKELPLMAGGNEKREEKKRSIVRLPELFDYVLDEPNVLLLDMAEAKLDDGEWEETEEILRIDSRFREVLGYPKRTGNFPQPWAAEKRTKEEYTLTLRYRILSQVETEPVELALENAESTEIWLNGTHISKKIEGYYVDRSIQKIALPGMHAGENILMVKIPYTPDVQIEAMYLLGTFGVNVKGRTAVLTGPEPELAFSDVCHQGLPFYGGNITYRVPVKLETSGDVRTAITRFRCPLIQVKLDGKPAGMIAFSPYELCIHGVNEGEHLLELVAYGNRVNTFGAVHNCNETFWWWGPESWRTTGAEWSYEYHLKPCGILKSPVITQEMQEEQA